MGPLVTYPVAGGGKYHASRDGFTPVALCRESVMLNLHHDLALVIQPRQERVHPIVCKRCLAIWGGLS